MVFNHYTPKSKMNIKPFKAYTTTTAHHEAPEQLRDFTAALGLPTKQRLKMQSWLSWSNLIGFPRLSQVPLGAMILQGLVEDHKSCSKATFSKHGGNSRMFNQFKEGHFVSLILCQPTWNIDGRFSEIEKQPFVSLFLWTRQSKYC